MDFAISYHEAWEMTLDTHGCCAMGWSSSQEHFAMRSVGWSQHGRQGLQQPGLEAVASRSSPSLACRGGKSWAPSAVIRGLDLLGQDRGQQDRALDQGWPD